MDPVSFLTAGTLFVATSIARKAGDELLDETWEVIKREFQRLFGREPTPNELTAPKVAAIVNAQLAVMPAIRHLWASSNVLRRAQTVERALEGAHLLWIDDDPAGNRLECECLTAFGVRVTTVERTTSAIDYLAGDPIDLVLSDIAREGSMTEGLDALPRLHEAAPDVPVIFYVTQVEARGVPAGAFGITRRPDELLHLCMDALERRRL